MKNQPEISPKRWDIFISFSSPNSPPSSWFTDETKSSGKSPQSDRQILVLCTTLSSGIQGYCYLELSPVPPLSPPQHEFSFSSTTSHQLSVFSTSHNMQQEHKCYFDDKKTKNKKRTKHNLALLRTGVALITIVTKQNVICIMYLKKMWYRGHTEEKSKEQEWKNEDFSPL